MLQATVIIVRQIISIDLQLLLEKMINFDLGLHIVL